MTRFHLALGICAVLAACGDPLSDVEKLSAVDLDENAASVEALPSAEKAAPEGGFFAGILGKRQPQEPASQTDAAVSAALQEQSADGTVLALAPAEPEAQRRGLFGFLRSKDTPAAASVPAASPSVSTVEVASAEAGSAEATLVADPAKVEAVLGDAPQAEARPRKGLFALLGGARAKDKDAAAQGSVQTASLGGVSESALPDENSPKTGLFAGRDRPHKGPDAQIVPYGSALPPGALARVCDLPRGRLGKEVDKFPARGRGYKLYDSNPSSGGARPFYVTGFDDNCARTFTAALALFGSPTMHEQLRYGLPSSVQPYSTTDKAYEGIKRAICGVGKRKSCGAKIGLLEKDTVFISIYDRIGSNAQWSNVLLHKGWVLAADRKGG